MLRSRIWAICVQYVFALQAWAGTQAPLKPAMDFAVIINLNLNMAYPP